MPQLANFSLREDDRRKAQVPIADVQHCRYRTTIADRERFRHDVAMSWIADVLIQEFWEGVVELAYYKWGWPGGIVAFFSPILFVVIAIWALFR